MLHFVYTLVNFLILAAILYFAGRKTVVHIFRSRRERIDRALDEAERIENEQPVLPEIPESFSDTLPQAVTEKDGLEIRIHTNKQGIEILLETEADCFGVEMDEQDMIRIILR